MYYVRKTLSCQQKEILTSSEFQIPALRKNCSYLEFFWFVFSRIQTGTFYILTDFNRLKRRNSLTNFYIQRIYTLEIWGVQDFQLHPHPPTPDILWSFPQENYSRTFVPLTDFPWIFHPWTTTPDNYLLRNSYWDKCPQTFYHGQLPLNNL